MLEGGDARRVLHEVFAAANRRATKRGYAFTVAMPTAAIGSPAPALTAAWGTQVFSAWDRDTPLAAVLVGWANGYAYTLESGSTVEGYRCSASVWLHWRILNLLAEHGFKSCRLGGTTASAARPQDPAHGLFLFKTGFSPQVVRCRGARSTFDRPHMGVHRFVAWARPKLWRSESPAKEHQVGGPVPNGYLMEKFTIKGAKHPAEVNVSLSRRAVAKATCWLKSSMVYNVRAVAETRREAAGRRAEVGNNRAHLIEAVEWVLRAQDATPDRGVSRGYGVGWVPHLDQRGWQPSYPETTGYIIPSLFDCAEYLQRPDLRRRAVEMADWEIEIQLPDGAVMAGTVNSRPTPAVFNTGQVMLGWSRAYQETEVERYRSALERAARYLVTIQAADGAWRKVPGAFADPSSITYYARVGWALVLYGKSAGNDAYAAAGIRSLEYTLSQQQENGWFARNCLSNADAPLTHTICYALEGLLGGYELLGDTRYLNAVILTRDSLMRPIAPDGFLQGRFDSLWRPAVSWSCLSGSAQLAGVLLRLSRITRSGSHRDAARRLLAFLKSTQNRVAADPGLRGGIKGSFPFDGEYCRFEVLNWATKFFIDALLLDDRLVGAG